MKKPSEAIDDEVRRISDRLYLRAKTILTSRRTELERIARELIRKETLDRHQIELLLLPKRSTFARLIICNQANHSMQTLLMPFLDSTKSRSFTACPLQMRMAMSTRWIMQECSAPGQRA